MRSENGFCHGAGLEQAETEQDGVAHNAPNGVDGIPGNCHALDQHGINCHADEDEKALKAQCEQAFQVVLPHVRLLVVAEGCHGDGCKAHHAIYLNHSSVHDDKNDDAQDSHGDADEETLQEKPEQGAYVHLHQAGLQHGKPDVVHPRVARNNVAGICHHLLRHVEHRHDDVKRIRDHPNRNGSFENPLQNQCWFKLYQIVVFSNHLNQFIASNECQNHTCNGQHHIPGEGFDHSENARFKTGWFGADLLCDVAHLGVDVIKQAGEIGHDRRCQQ